MHSFVIVNSWEKSLFEFYIIEYNIFKDKLTYLLICYKTETLKLLCHFRNNLKLIKVLKIFGKNIL